MQLQQGKVVPSDKHMYVLQKSNTVFHLLVLSCGIALKITLKIAKLNKLVRQNSNVFLISSYLDTVENAHTNK